ncbi:uncharacterized protein TNCT_231461 [Trichonephila clavata]|uniref:Uncharacterized protein n=1 Tax=Trichonephila clavata TaxID=2740835 RepID=A0A8X6GZZ4_TRICU|nr:uncharacterized protein TNCT_231461 [Trichonephila clavata]
MNYTQKRKPTQSYWSGFTTYCRRLCIQSLITGFPVIAATRNVLRKALKIFVFVVCTCGFLYQTSGFLNLYWAYPTMVGIQMENPDSVSLPAVTVCNRNRIRRKALCTLAPSICQWSTNRDIFCSINPKYCVPWETDEQTVLAIPNFDRLLMMNRTLENVEIMGQRPEDLIAGCSIRSDIFSSCTNILTVSVVNNNGYPNNCVAIETLWGQPDGQPQKLPVTGQISLYLTMRPEDYIDYYDLVLAHVFMHEPQSLCNPIKEGITLEAGKSYDIFVNKRVTIRLPAPYKTNCTDYLKLWRKNGDTGP